MREIFIKIAVIYIVVMSLIGFVTMGVDKRKAIHNKWRISEVTLILIAFLGGGMGSFLGMRWFRHKTKHVKFVVFIPLTAIMYFIITSYLVSYKIK
jgi:uncharacterized membrane protein YsdA (DUF1294 family)